MSFFPPKNLCQKNFFIFKHNLTILNFLLKKLYFKDIMKKFGVSSLISFYLVEGGEDEDVVEEEINIEEI